MRANENLLIKAMQVIPTQEITYFRYASRTINDIGIYVSSFEDGVVLMVNVQPVESKELMQMGLDYSRRAVWVWSNENLEELARGRSGDQFEFDSERYEVIIDMDWPPIAQWGRIMGVRID